MPHTDTLGDRCKAFETDAILNHEVLNPERPIYIRIDGRAFSAFTHGMHKPYDAALSRCLTNVMVETMKAFGFRIGYRQSDEISFVWRASKPESQAPFGGKRTKLLSVVPAYAAAVLQHELSLLEERDTRAKLMSERMSLYPSFDARVYNLPTTLEVVETLLWREEDATRNAVQALAQQHFSHSRLQGVSTGDQLLLLWEAGIDITTFDPIYRRGQWAMRRPGLTTSRDTVGVIPDALLLRDVMNQLDYLFRSCAPAQTRSKP